MAELEVAVDYAQTSKERNFELIEQLENPIQW